MPNRAKTANAALCVAERSSPATVWMRTKPPIRRPARSASRSGSKNPAISRKHPLLREFSDDTLTVHCAEGITLLRIASQSGDSRGKSRCIIAGHDELSVSVAYDALYVSDIDRGNRAACRHRLQQRIRHLLCIGRQRKDVKRTKNRFGRGSTCKNY